MVQSSQFLGHQDTRCHDATLLPFLTPSSPPPTTFHSPNPDSLHCGGTAVIMPKSLLPQYYTSHRIFVAGALDFHPLDPRAAAFTLINVYLKSNNQAVVISSLSPLSKTPRRVSPTSLPLVIGT